MFCTYVGFILCAIIEMKGGSIHIALLWVILWVGGWQKKSIFYEIWKVSGGKRVNWAVLGQNG